MKKNDKVKIYDDESIFISEGIIYDVVNPLNVLIENTNFYEFFINQLILFEVSDNDSGVVMHSGIIKKIFQNTIELSDVAYIQKRQCRYHPRINISIIGTVLERTLVGDDVISYDVDISNLSVGGIYFVTNDEIKNPDGLIISFNIGSTKMSLSFQVVRKEILEKNTFGYGCKIIDVPKNFEPMLNTFAQNY